MNIRELIACPLMRCVPMSDAEYRALLRRQRKNVGGRARMHLHECYLRLRTGRRPKVSFVPSHL